MGGESLPLVNIVGATRLRIGRPKPRRTTFLLIALVMLLGGAHFSATPLGWALMGAGALLGAWAWFFHRQRAWVVRLHLLLNQRIQILFESQEDAEAFLTALVDAKGGAFPVQRLT